MNTRRGVLSLDVNSFQSDDPDADRMLDLFHAEQ